MDGIIIKIKDEAHADRAVKHLEAIGYSPNESTGEFSKIKPYLVGKKKGPYTLLLKKEETFLLLI